jgi:hypothetical protein
MSRSNTPWLRLVHYVGDGTTASPVTLASPTYDLNYSPNAFTTRTSYATWKAADDTASPTARAFKAKHRMTFAWWLSATMTSSTWQTNLATIRIGNTQFAKPTHTHCVDSTTTYDNTPYHPSGGLWDTYIVPGVLGNWAVTYTVLDNLGAVVPYPVFEWYSSGVLEFRAVGNAAGEVTGVRFYEVGAGGTAVYSNDRQKKYLLTSGFNSPFGDPGKCPNPVVSPVGGFIESEGITSNIWPTTTFTMFGHDWIEKNKSWMPPIEITKTSSTNVTFSASLAMLRLDHIRPLSFSAAISNPLWPTGSVVISSSDETGSDPLLPYYVRADHAAIEPGLFRGSGGSWVAVSGSYTTGWTAPTQSPTCPFVVVQGTPP